MGKGNILVLGNSGVGKSTLINAVLGERRAATGWGNSGRTKRLYLYENSELPFRLIDTIGFEPSYFKERTAINAVKDWSKERAKDADPDNDINVIWYCVDGTSRKLFPKTITNLIKATSIWKTVPVIVVITKSYSVPDRKHNIEMVQNIFFNQKKKINLKRIIPVVAQTYILNETAFAPPEGITDLIDATNELLPEGKKAAKLDVGKYKLGRKRVFAQSVVAASTVSGVAVGALPIPVADGVILSGVEMAEIKTIAALYGIKSSDRTQKFLNTIVEVGTVSAAAKAIISAIKAIPGIAVAAAVLNAVIAGCFVAAIGEGSVLAFEQVYLGNKTLDDLDWLKKLMENQFAGDFLKKVKEILVAINDKTDAQEIVEMILNLFADTKRKGNKK